MADESDVTIEAKLNAERVNDGIEEIKSKVEGLGADLESAGSSTEHGMLGTALFGAAGVGALVGAAKTLVDEIGECVNVAAEYEEKMHSALDTSDTLNEKIKDHKDAWKELKQIVGEAFLPAMKELETSATRTVDKIKESSLFQGALTAAAAALGATVETFTGGGEETESERLRREQRDREKAAIDNNARRDQISKESEDITKAEDKFREKMEKAEEGAPGRTSDLLERLGKEQDRERERMQREIESREKQFARSEEIEERRLQMQSVKSPEHEREIHNRVETFETLFRRMATGDNSTRDKDQDKAERREVERRREELRRKFHEEDQKKLQEQIDVLKKMKGGLA